MSDQGRRKVPAPAASDDATASHSLILSGATRVLMPLLLMLSVFLLVRGHNEPGGGIRGRARRVGGVRAVCDRARRARRSRCDPRGPRLDRGGRPGDRRAQRDFRLSWQANRT